MNKGSLEAKTGRLIVTQSSVLNKIIHKRASVISGWRAEKHAVTKLTRAVVCFCWSVQELYSVIWKSDIEHL